MQPERERKKKKRQFNHNYVLRAPRKLLQSTRDVTEKRRKTTVGEFLLIKLRQDANVASEECADH